MQGHAFVAALYLPPDEEEPDHDVDGESPTRKSTEHGDVEEVAINEPGE